MRPYFLMLFLSFSASSAEFLQQVATRYDGVTATAIVAGPGGRVYAATAGGLMVFENGRWTAAPGSPAGAVTALAGDSGQIVYVSGGRLYRGNAAAGAAAESVAGIALVDGQPLMATDAGIIAKGAADAGFAKVAGASPGVRQIAARGNRIAVAAQAGLFERDGSGSWQRLLPGDGARSWAPEDVRSVAYDARGRLLFASRQGIGIRDGQWRLLDARDGLPYDDLTSIAAAEDGSVWIGTHLGAIHFDGKTWEYRQGLRWLPNDDVRAIATAGNQTWFATASGIGLIETKPTTFAAKAELFENEIDRRHRRTSYGYVLGVRTAKPGDASEATQDSSDNDGLWTAMYGAGECFACAATGNPKACERATAAFEALRFLGTVTQGGSHPAPPGFVARSILPVSGKDPNIADSPERDRRTRANRDPLWKIIAPRWPVSADGKWYWKSDTSSDELDGHYFFYAAYYDHAAKTVEQKRRVRDHVAALTDHLIDHGFQLVDHDGKVTRWGVFDPASLNHDPEWWEERSLNSISILSYLKVAEHVTGDAKYAQAAQKLIREHSYAMNTLISKTPYGFGSGNQSDDEMAFMCLYNLTRYEKDTKLLEMYRQSLRQRWDVERPESCPLFDFIGAAGLGEARGEWLEQSLDTLRRYPLDRFNWGLKNSHRLDVTNLPRFAGDGRRGHRRNGMVLPIDERYVDHWNHDPWQLDYRGDGRHLADGASFLLPYHMGQFLGFVEK